MSISRTRTKLIDGTEKANVRPRKKAALPALPANAIKADLPLTLLPQLATLVDAPPDDSTQWLYEIKFDGYRLLVRKEGGKIQVFTRNRYDWSHRLPNIIEAVGEMNLEDCWLDGEIVVTDQRGIPDFQALQNAFESSSNKAFIYYVFDIPFYNGYDLRACPFAERKEFVKAVLEKRTSETVRLSETFDVSAREILHSAYKMGLEGVIGKRKTSTHVSRRSPDWIKLKCTDRQEFVIGGYRASGTSRKGIGSLLLGYYDEEGKLRYAGKVGTGFTQKSLEELKEKLDEIETHQNPFTGEVERAGEIHWVKPALVAEVSFSEWTDHGHIRHPSFRGLRADKKAEQITREKPVS